MLWHTGSLGKQCEGGAGAVKLSLTLQSVPVGCITALVSTLQRLTQAADRWPFRCTTAVNEAWKGPFPLAYLWVCECLRWHSWAGRVWLYQGVQQVVNTHTYTHTHTLAVVNFWVINKKWSIDILCCDCTQSAWITKLIVEEERRLTGLLFTRWKTQPWWFHVRARSCCVAMTTCHSGCSACHSTSSCFAKHTLAKKHTHTHTHTFSHHWWMFGSRFFLRQDLKHPFALSSAHKQTQW